MKTQGQLCEKDYLDAQMLHMKGIVSKRFMVVCTLIFILLLIRGIYEALHGNFNFNYLFPLAFFIALFYFQFVLLSKQAKKIFAQQKSLSAPFEYEFAESGLKMTNEFGESRIPWEKIYYVT